jgi:hypothetical protein
MARAGNWRSVWRSIGHVLVVVLVAAAAGTCGRGDRANVSGADSATGEVKALNYEATNERYQKWLAAQRALDATPGLPAPPTIDPMHLGEPELQRAISYLEGDPRARAALARAGISARDYVMTTVALDQALVASSSSASVSASASPTPAAAAPSSRSSSPVAPSARGSGATPAPPAAAAARSAVAARSRVAGAPAQNVELVRRNRGDVVRVLRTMRFRISKPTAEDVVDTTVRRVDSVQVGKDITVKWDVTVRRNRDSSARDSSRRRSGDRRGSPAPADTAHPDSTAPR